MSMLHVKMDIELKQLRMSFISTHNVNILVFSDCEHSN